MKKKEKTKNKKIEKMKKIKNGGKLMGKIIKSWKR